VFIKPKLFEVQRTDNLCRNATTPKSEGAAHRNIVLIKRQNVL
jgi:hypothetical protein